jgi:DNA polymerase III delta prime subunit
MTTKKDEPLFIHKFQPIHLDDFGMDDDMHTFIKTLIQMNNLNVLLTGNMASGKTSLLSAIIREYYGGKLHPENVLYINSLKEQGQQVFRNCIDKYSHNVHFISSCCNIQKVIESLQSRFILVKVKPLNRDNLTRLITKIKQVENIEMDPDAEDFVINLSNNTVKVLVNYMEKFKLYGSRITLDHAMSLCSNISFQIFETYTKHIKAGELNPAIKLIYDIYDKGYSVMDILDNYFVFIKSTDILNEDEKYRIIPYICKYITIFHDIHEDEIELALFTNNLCQTLYY